jgi:hypothetical protein
MGFSLHSSPLIDKFNGTGFDPVTRQLSLRPVYRICLIYLRRFVMIQSHMINVLTGFSPHLRAGRLLGGRLVKSFVWSLVFCSLAIAFSDSSLAAKNVYTIAESKVDMTAKTAALARDKALFAGQAKAMQRLLARIALNEDISRLPKVNPALLADLVRDFEVIDEKTSKVRYLATLKVRFKSDAVRGLLRGYGIGFAETRSKPVLVLPIYEVSGAYSLWDNPNPWRASFLAQPSSDGLVPLIHPKGDLRDISLIGAEQAVRGNDKQLSAIAKRYGAVDVLVVIVRQHVGTPKSGLKADAKSEGAENKITKKPATAHRLQVTMSRVGTTRLEQTRLMSFDLVPGEPIEEGLKRAARAVVVQVEEGWKRANRLRFDTGTELTAEVPITSLADWLDIKKRLKQVAFVRRSDLIYISKKTARIRLNFLGDEDQLTVALSQSDLNLSRGPIYWNLHFGKPQDRGAQKTRSTPPLNPVVTP